MEAIVFPFTNSVKLEGDRLIISALPFGVETVEYETAQMIGIID